MRMYIILFVIFSDESFEVMVGGSSADLNFPYVRMYVYVWYDMTCIYRVYVHK